MEQDNKQDNPDSLPNFSKPVTPVADNATSSSADFAQTMSKLSNEPNYNKTSGNKLTLFLVLIMVLFLLVGGSLASIYLIANGTVKLSNNALREKVAYISGLIPFMPKTPEYVLMQSAKVHEDIASAYFKGSVIINSDEFKKSLPIFQDGIDIAIEGPIDATDEDNPKMGLNFKLTKEFDMDFRFLDNVMYAKLNKIPSFTYPLIGLTESNIKSAPFLNNWISYDLSGLDTDARSAFENRDKQKENTEELSTEVENRIKKLTSDRILPLIKMTTEDLDGKPMYKLTIKMDENQTQEYYKEIFEIIAADKSTNANLYTDDIARTQFKGLEATIWINKSNYYFTKATSVSDIEISQPDMSSATGVLGITTSSEPTAMQENTNDQVLGVRTINSEDPAFKFSMATSISLDKHGENFEAELVKPAQSIDFETFMLQMTSFMQNQQTMPYSTMENDGFGQQYDDANGFE